jgi:hypothetical protein
MIKKIIITCPNLMCGNRSVMSFAVVGSKTELLDDIIFKKLKSTFFKSSHLANHDETKGYMTQLPG